MDAADPLHDPGLPGARLLARFFQAGIVVIDEHDAPAFASAAACDLLGVANEPALRAAWDDIRDGLRIAEWPRQLPDGSSFRGRADFSGRAGGRSIRFEMHAAACAGRTYRIAHMRDRERLQATDDALILAAEADANQHVLGGLVHSAKGPLNNFNLTLALLTAAISRVEASEFTPEMLARWKRYAGVLAHESERLALCIDSMHALTLRHEPSRKAIDVCALLRECAHVLRHDATMREIALDIDVPESGVHAIGDPRLVRLALVSLTIALLDCAPQGARVGLRLDAATVRTPTIMIAMSEGTTPPGLVADLFRVSGMAECEHFAAAAARLIVEAQGGELSVIGEHPRTPGFVIRIPSID